MNVPGYGDFEPYSISMAHTFYVCPQCSALVLHRNIHDHIGWHTSEIWTNIEVTAPVVEGSIVLVEGLAGMDWENHHSTYMDLQRVIAKACGHEHFCIVFTGVPGATKVEAWGPDEDLQAKLQELLTRLGF